MEAAAHLQIGHELPSAVGIGGWVRERSTVRADGCACHTPPQNQSTLPHVQPVAATDGHPEPGTRIILSGDAQAPTELALTGLQTTPLLILTGFLVVSGIAFVACSNDLIRKGRFTF